jgi:ADP-ribose pyrophosphatase YjhB (NUDIX family)
VSKPGTMAERREQVDLTVETLQLPWVVEEVAQPHHGPRHLHCLVLAEGRVPAQNKSKKKSTTSTQQANPVVSGSRERHVRR